MSTTFSDQQYDMAYPPGVEHHWWTTARNKLLADILEQESDGDSALLEVGCGRGVVVKSLRNYGFNMRGVELADVKPLDAVQTFVDYNTDACELSIERRAEVTGILLLDVIEHLPEPEQFLRKLEDSFPNLKVLIITVPACQEIWSNYDVYYGHHRRYSLETIDTLADDIGWTTQQSGYFFHTPYLPGRLMSMLGIDRGTKIASPGKASRYLHSLLSLLFRMEQAIVPRAIKGTSAYAVFHPSKESSGVAAQGSA